MKLHLSLLALALVALPIASNAAQDDPIIIDYTDAHHDDTSTRNLAGAPDYPAVCKSPAMYRGDTLKPNQAICGPINGTMVYYGIRSYKNEPQTGYTLYRQEMWSDDGRHNRWFRGIGMNSSLPYPILRLQGDANVVFAGQGNGCLAKPGKRGPNISMSIEGPLPDLLKVRDNDGFVVSKISYKLLSNNSTYIGGSQCYPDVGPRYVSVLKERQRLTWNEYVCEFDAFGDCIARFGLDSYGLLAFWRNGVLKWRPGPYHIRGDYLHLQGDGHLTLYRDTKPSPTITWASNCFKGVNASKIAVAAGDVVQMNGDGSTAWTLVGDASLSPVCFPGCDV